MTPTRLTRALIYSGIAGGIALVMGYFGAVVGAGWVGDVRNEAELNI